MNIAPRILPSLLRVALAAALALPMAGLTQNIDRIAFGSCANQDKPQPIWTPILADAPDLFLFLGDNVYADTDDPAQLQASYDTLGRIPGLQKLLASTPVMAIWDDHDYGPNNSDRLSPSREAAQLAYRHYVPHYPLPADAELVGQPLAERPIAQAFSYGRVRFILLDSRSQRDPVNQADDADKTMLGTWQREWLQRELLATRDTHPLTFILTTVPWISDETGTRDNWGRYPTERAELSRWMVDNHIRGVCFLGGDAHMLAADNGRHNTYAGQGQPGFPVLQAGPLDRSGSVKGGPWSVTPVLPADGEGQFGLVEIEDHGDRLDVLFRGLNQHGHEKLRLAFVVKVP